MMRQPLGMIIARRKPCPTREIKKATIKNVIVKTVRMAIISAVDPLNRPT